MEPISGYLKRSLASIVLLSFLTLILSEGPLLADFEVTVKAGDATISKTGNITTITSHSNSIFEGNTSIGSNETVRILGSNNSLLRDTTGLRTDWLGKLLSEGNVILVNTHGVYIARSASINVSSLIASTLNIQNEDFLRNNFSFQRVQGLDPAKILNQASIRSKDKGYLVLISDQVENQGTLTAYLGTVALGSGTKMTVSFDPEGLINLVVNEGLAQELNTHQILNTGEIKADGGRIQMTAKLLKTTLQSIVNNDGIIQATHAIEHDGIIELVADGAITNTGSIKASQVTEEGYTFRSSGSLEVGHMTLDNLDNAADISGPIQGVFSDFGDIRLIGAVSLTGDTTLQADSDTNNSGKINMQTFDLEGGGFNLTLYTGENVTLNSLTNIDTLTLNSSNNNDRTYTSPTAKSFSVDTLKTNYHSIFTRDKVVGGYQMIYSDSNALGGLQFISTNLSGLYKLANNIDASETSSWNATDGFVPISTFTGTFDGDNHTISNLTIHRPTEDNVGLFGYTDSAIIQNVGLTSVNITGASYTSGLVGYNYNSSSIDNSYVTGSVTGTDYVGGLVGYNYNASIDNSYATATITGTSNLGGLVGGNGGTLTNSFYNIDSVPINGDNIITSGGIYNTQYQDWITHSKTLTIGNYFSLISGYYQITSVNDLKNLLGFTESVSTDKYKLTNNLDLTAAPNFYIPSFAAQEFDGNSKTISNLNINLPNSNVGFFGSATNTSIHDLGIVNASVTGANYVGGLVGYNINSSIDNSYTTGTVTGALFVGGLVGCNLSSTISNSYATGTVTGTYRTGGLVGVSYNFSYIINSYATGTVTGAAYTGGLVGSNSSSSTIDNSYATGNVTGTDQTGGLVGNADSSTISNSYATGIVTGTLRVGGLTGDNINSSVNNSYATGTVIGSNYVGGFVGRTFGSSIDNAYSTGAVSCTGVGCNQGGLVGRDDGGGGTYTNNWWSNALANGIGNNMTNETAGQWEKALSASAFFNPTHSVYTANGGWDISSTHDGSIWGISTNNGAYPKLQFRYSTSIQDAYQLQLMYLDLDATYTLANDINASETSTWNPDGTGDYLGFEPISIFTGTFDGQDNTISNLFIDRPGDDNIGLFGQTNGSTIKHIKLENIDITGSHSVGGLVGYSYNLSHIENAYTTGTVTGTSNAIGGLVGYNYNQSTIDNSYSTADVLGINNVGGLVGDNYDSFIRNSYSRGTVTGTSRVGGLVGLNEYSSTIDNSYSTGFITGTTSTGGLVGFDDGTGFITHSFYDSETSGQSDIGKGIPKTTHQMKSRLTFTDAGWNFSNIWGKNVNEYPHLLWVDPSSTDRPPLSQDLDPTTIENIRNHISIPELISPTQHHFIPATQQLLNQPPIIIEQGEPPQLLRARRAILHPDGVHLE